MVSFPGFYRVATALILGLLWPQTRARRRFLPHAVASGWAAVQRRDFELMLVPYARGVQARRLMMTLAFAGATAKSGRLSVPAARPRPFQQSREAKPRRLLTSEGKRRQGRLCCLFTMADGRPGQCENWYVSAHDRHRWRFFGRTGASARRHP